MLLCFFDAVTAFASMLRALVCQQSSRDCPTYEALLATGFFRVHGDGVNHASLLLARSVDGA